MDYLSELTTKKEMPYSFKCFRLDDISVSVSLSIEPFNVLVGPFLNRLSFYFLYYFIYDFIFIFKQHPNRLTWPHEIWKHSHIYKHSFPLLNSSNIKTYNWLVVKYFIGVKMKENLLEWWIHAIRRLFRLFWSPEPEKEKEQINVGDNEC